MFQRDFLEKIKISLLDPIKVLIRFSVLDTISYPGNQKLKKPQYQENLKT